MNGAEWRVWIDTGGTFTDCVAVSDRGELSRRKVLSTGRVRSVVTSPYRDGRVGIRPVDGAADGLFEGFILRPLGLEREARVVGHRDHELELEGAVREEGTESWESLLKVGRTIELDSGWEAPMLGLRMLFGLSARAPLPTLDLRLGTTRGTNALLERCGARCALVVTRGHRDLLEIGDQTRPDLFARAIVKPRALQEITLEVDERLAAGGVVVKPLIEGSEAAIDFLARARDCARNGVTSAAVALLHGYANPDHELKVADLLRRAGFEHVSVSSDLTRLAGILPRAQTTLVDAYLAPILGDYLRGIATQIEKPFYVMTSAGGLVRNDRFKAKDGLLSGPAGGVLGCAIACAAAGLQPALAFDMGGTSTDVSRIDGEIEYDQAHRVGEATVLAPAIAIRSVAAGGGSICRVEGGRLRVGPQSAGADPGPACYGRGGPLTVTDVNLLLGRIDGARFEVPLDQEAGRRALRTQAVEQEGLADEDLLEGFLRIANERMAETVRLISTRRGFDPGDHALAAFGGAGGQHACEIAELLGIDEILIPADCSLLSARGIGAASVERIVQTQVLLPTTSPDLQIAVAKARSAVEESLRSEEETRVRGTDELETEVWMSVRFVGQGSGLEIPAQPIDTVHERFLDSYQRLFGYDPERPAEVEWLRVRTRPARHALDLIAPNLGYRTGTQRPAQARHQQVWSEASWHQVPVIERWSLPENSCGDDSVAGPLLISEDYSSTWVPSGWRAWREPRGQGLRIRRLVAVDF